MPKSRARTIPHESGARWALFLTARVGVGHTSAADAVRAQLAVRGIGGETVDAYRYAASIFSKVVSDGYIGMVRTVPHFYGYIYDRAERVKSAGGFRVWAAEFTARNLRALIARVQPSVVVCTHAFSCNAMSAYKRLYDPTLPVIGVVTDFVVHPFWIYGNVDAYAVATPQMRRALIERGIAPERVRVDGIPVDMRFADRSRSRAAIRLQLDLPVDRPVVLVMGGGLGMGPIAWATRALAALGPDLTVVVVAGRNARLGRHVRAAARAAPYHIRVLGFVDNVVDYMLASDVLLTKPGGLTTSEALSAELPIVLITPLPGQEERNATYLAESGAALRPARHEIARAVDAVLGDSARAQGLRVAAAKVRTPYAAATIAERIDEIARVR